MDIVPNVKLKVVVPDEQVSSRIGAIERSAQTGHIGCGKLLVVPIEEASRIRTGERVQRRDLSASDGAVTPSLTPLRGAI